MWVKETVGTSATGGGSCEVGSGVPVPAALPTDAAVFWCCSVRVEKPWAEPKLADCPDFIRKG